MKSLGPKISTLRQAGGRRLLARLRRRARYLGLYPLVGERLFPLLCEGEKGSVPISDFNSLLEEFSGRMPESGRVLPGAEELGRNRFGFLNLPPVDLGSPVDWDRSPLGDPPWVSHLHYGEWAEVGQFPGGTAVRLEIKLYCPENSLRP